MICCKFAATALGRPMNRNPSGNVTSTNAPPMIAPVQDYLDLYAAPAGVICPSTVIVGSSTTTEKTKMKRDAAENHRYSAAC